ncbi:MAG: hypothetical protein ACMUIU_08495 [bacterium]
MNKKVMIVCFLVIMITVFIFGSAMAVDWRFPLALTYSTGWKDVKDLYEDNLRDIDDDEVSTVPLGISFNPYVEFSSGFGVGAGFGPLMLIWDNWDYVLPLKLDFRYTIMPQNTTAAYFRLGPSYHFVKGYKLHDGSPGFFVGTGVEFLRNRKLGFGFEISYDSAEIESERRIRFYDEYQSDYRYYTYKEEIKSCEFMFSLYLIY